MKLVDVYQEIEIAAPVARVAAFAADPDHAPLWYENIRSAEWRSPRPLAVGSQVAFVAHFLGRRLSYVYEVVEWVPDARMVMRTADGPFPMETTYTWEAIEPDRCRMGLRNAGRPSGFTGIFAPFMARAMAKANRKDLLRIKQLMEQEPAP